LRLRRCEDVSPKTEPSVQKYVEGGCKVGFGFSDEKGRKTPKIRGKI
jgi:hypothetical protein